jgi:SNF2 family DNA or RNA helicase
VKFRFDELNNLKADVLIIDELTAFKNISADRHKMMKKIAKNFKAVWGITGAPTPNSPTEAFGQARVVNPNNPDLPKYFGQYRDIVVTEIVQGVFIPTIHAQAMVHRILQPAIRFTRDECLDIPPVTKQVVEVEMTKEQNRLYDDMRKQMYASYDRGEITASNAGVNLMKLLQISAGAVYDDERLVCLCDCEEKYDQIIETFEELGRTKLIVVAAFVNVVERLTERLKADGIRAAYIHGSMGNRDYIINSFQEGDLQILVVQPQAVSHGLTLTASSTIIWHSYVQSGEVHLQMNGRITRAGQDKKQYVKYLTCSAAERKTLDRLEGKQDFSDSILGLFANREL